jgi:hypothetical protein
MPTRSRHLEGPLDVVLSSHLVKINLIGSLGIEERPTIQMEWGNDDLTIQKFPSLF